MKVFVWCIGQTRISLPLLLVIKLLNICTRNVLGVAVDAVPLSSVNKSGLSFMKQGDGLQIWGGGEEGER
jgi:hypothetical protein